MIKKSLPDWYIEKVRKDFIQGPDGYFTYWPYGLDGSLNSFVLRAIADELDKCNLPWDQNIEEYFNSQPDNENGIALEINGKDNQE